MVTLREIAPDDAQSLAQQVSDPRVVRYLTPPPSTVAGFRRFARGARAQRRRGAQLCFAIVPHRRSKAIGLIQIWPIESDFTTAEWGFVIGRAFWGTGMFQDAATLLLDFAFARMGVRRLEARAAAANRRGNGALRKLGATREGCLRGAFRADTEGMNSVMWSILADEHLSRKAMHPALIA
jgi:RimJ/RimL family protein N-acetyltransferase